MKNSLQYAIKREYQIREILYSLGGTGATAVIGRLPKPQSYSTILKLQAILEEKDYLRYAEDDWRSFYQLTKQGSKVNYIPRKTQGINCLKGPPNARISFSRQKTITVMVFSSPRRHLTPRANLFIGERT